MAEPRRWKKASEKDPLPWDSRERSQGTTNAMEVGEGRQMKFI